MKKLILLIAVTLAGLVPSRAANVFLKSSDGFGTSSITNGSNWSDNQVPNPANDYFTGPYFIRTPAGTAGTTYTFQGHSLTLSSPTPGQARNIIFKGGNMDVIVIDNLTNALGGIIENGGSGAQTVTYTGNLFTIAENSVVDANQGPLICGYPLAGAEGVILTNAGGNVITYMNDNSGFKGKFYISSSANYGNGGGNTTVVLGAANSAPANPSTFTPDQITLEAGCTLRDDVGLTLNNANSGITLLGNANINAASTTVINEPITGAFTLTATGAGTLVLNSANNTYGNTTVSAGTLQVGVANALPVARVTANSTFDINAISTTIDDLRGAGTVDTFAGGTPTLTVGANGGSGTFSGVIQNSAGTLSLTKVGAGTQTLAGGYTYSGPTLVAGGTLSLSTTAGFVPTAPGDLIVSNAAVLEVDASSAIVTLPANNIVLVTNSTLRVLPSSAMTSITVAGNLTLQDNATNGFDFGALTANPTATEVINVTGGISAPGTNIVIQVDGFGFVTPATITLIRYTGTPLGSLANFSLALPPGTVGMLVNNTANHSIDLNITAAPRSLSWYGAASANWDLATANWKFGAADTVFMQGGSPLAGDGVLFDDTLTNDFINPQPTNINLTATFSPVKLVVDSTLPYSFGGAGGIAGATSLVKTNTGSLTITTANSYTGGTVVYGGSVVINNDSALGAAGVGVTLSGGALGFSGNTTSTRPITTTVASSIDVASGVTAQLDGTVSAVGTLSKTGDGTLALTATDSVNGGLRVLAGTLSVTAGSLAFTGNPSYVGYLTGNGTLNLSGSSTLNSAGELRVGGSDTSGATYNATGTLNMSGGNAYLSALTIARGNDAANSCAGEVNISGGTMTSTNDVLVGFAGSGKGTLRISGTGTLNVGTTVTKWLRFGQWDTTSGEITISGGNLNLNQGTSIKINQNNSSGPKTFTQDGGAVTFYSDFATTVGGGGDLDLMLTGTAAATNTYNLNGGTLTVPRVRSSGSSGTRVFNFNGGTLKPTASSTTFFNLGSGNATANVRNGGAIIDVGAFNVTIAQALVHSTIAGDNATDGGLTKNGSGSVILNGANTYNGNTTVNAGALITSTASSLAGAVAVSDGATFSVVQNGSATNKMGNLTLNGAGAVPGATLGLGLTPDNDPSVPLINCGTLTLNGNNTISMAGSVKVGTIALIRAVGAVAGSGTITNLVLPQGAQGTIQVTSDGSFTTVSAVITSTGPGLTWAGGADNVWDINTTANWLLNSTPTTYQQTIVPGDAVTFNDSGSGTVTLNTSVGPASLVISNNSTAYTFSGSGNITGPTDLKKLGSGAATLNLANNSYAGDTVISNGTLTLGNATALPSSGNLVLGSSGTLELAGLSITIAEMAGSGTIDNNSGVNPVLTVGTSSGGTWNGTIRDQGAGGVVLHKVGSGTWVVGGNNYLNFGQPFGDLDLITSGTVVITNGGSLNVAELQLQIANGASQTAAVVVDGGTLAVTNNVLSVGYGDATATGTLTLNSGTVFHGGPGGGAFAAVGINCIDVGAQGATGTLTVNGGQVLNNSPLYLGDGATANGTLQLNGGLVQATVVGPNPSATPASSIVYFNGGTLQATTNSGDFILSTAMIQGGGATLDDGGYAIHIATGGFQDDSASPGGSFVKKGAGAVYFDGFNLNTGTTTVTEGTLAGIGGVTGPLIVAPAGNIGAGDEASPGTFYPSGNLTLQGNATVRIDKTGGTPLQWDNFTVGGNVTYGGTLTVSNVTSDATLLADGDAFQLFTVTGAKSGNFTSIVGSPGTGLAYKFTPSTGVLSIETSTIPNTPTNLTFSVVSGGNQLALNWPPSYLGWILQAQTNSLNTGIQTGAGMWFDVPGSASVVSTNMPLNPANPTVFYRLRHP